MLDEIAIAIFIYLTGCVRRTAPELEILREVHKGDGGAYLKSLARRKRARRDETWGDRMQKHAELRNLQMSLNNGEYLRDGMTDGKINLRLDKWSCHNTAE